MRFWPGVALVVVNELEVCFATMAAASGHRTVRTATRMGASVSPTRMRNSKAPRSVKCHQFSMEVVSSQSPALVSTNPTGSKGIRRVAGLAF